MNSELYAAFVLATVLLIIIPGPVVTLVLANSVSYGTRSALRTVIGAGSAATIQIIITGLGMTSVILLLSDWFQWVRWAGVAYLVWLGILAWRHGNAYPMVPPIPTSHGRLFWQGFLVALTNPKTLLFYAAFLPQFIDPAGNVGQQLAILSVTFLLIALCFDSTYALLAGRLRPILLSRRGALWRGRITGSILICAGFGLALARKSS